MKKIEAYDLSKNALLVDLFPSPVKHFDWPEGERRSTSV